MNYHIPQIYAESYDYRILLKMMDIIMTNYQSDSESLSDNASSFYCDDSKLKLLSDKLSYKYNNEISYYHNRLAMKYYLEMLRNKGTEYGLRLAIYIALIGYKDDLGNYYSSGIVDDVNADIMFDMISTSSSYQTLIISLSIRIIGNDYRDTPSSSPNVVRIRKLVELIKPMGVGLTINLFSSQEISPESLSLIETTDYAELVYNPSESVPPQSSVSTPQESTRDYGVSSTESTSD